MEKREKNYERLVRNIALCKEVADGLRIYLNYTLRDHLLYSEEYQQAEFYTSAAYRSAFVYVAPERQTLGMLSVPKTSSDCGADDVPGVAMFATEVRDVHAAAEIVESTKRRLRSYKNDESSEYILDIGPVSGAKAGDKSR